jgi:hypothetical protein
MAIKTKLGDVSGSAQSPSISITAFDFGSTIDRDAALAAAKAAAPTTILGCTLDLTDWTITDRSHESIEFQFGYGRSAPNTLTLSDGAQTKPKKLHNFIAPVGVYGVSGDDATSSYPSLKWKPDRQGSADEFNSGKPITVDPLPVGPRLSFNTSQSFVTDSYIDSVKTMVDRGVFNDAPFLGRATGTLQFVEFAVNQRDFDDWELVFGFGYRAFQASVEVGDGLIIPEYRGCDYYWIKEKEVFDAGSIQPKGVAVVVGQAWPFDDFEELNLPYQGRLSTRTSDTAGVITTIYSHGLTNTDNAIMFWKGGQRTGDISSGTSTTVTFSGLSGDALPPLNTNLTISKYVP